MQYLPLGVFLIGFIGGIWLLARSMTTHDRNDGSRHGGGLDEEKTGAADHYDIGGFSNND